MAADEGDCICLMGERKTEEAINEKELLGFAYTATKL
jgi:hypothetical protein